MQKSMKPLRNVATQKRSANWNLGEKIAFREKCVSFELGIFVIIVGIISSYMLSYFSFRIPFQIIITWTFYVFMVMFLDSFACCCLNCGVALSLKAFWLLSLLLSSLLRQVSQSPPTTHPSVKNEVGCIILNLISPAAFQ